MRRLAAVVLLSLPAAFMGCDSIECKDVRRQLCEKACTGCDFCQLMFPQAQASVLNSVNDCINVTAETVCTSDTETDALDACVSAVEASDADCEYEVPDACVVPGAFQSGE